MKKNYLRTSSLILVLAVAAGVPRPGAALDATTTAAAEKILSDSKDDSSVRMKRLFNAKLGAILDMADEYATAKEKEEGFAVVREEASPAFYEPGTRAMKALKTAQRAAQIATAQVAGRKIAEDLHYEAYGLRDGVFSRAVKTKGAEMVTISDRQNGKMVGQILKLHVDVSDANGAAIKKLNSLVSLFYSAGGDKAELLRVKVAWANNSAFYLSPDVF